MTRFLHWRKMTWAIVVWSAAMLVVLAGGALMASSASEVALACANDSAGLVTKSLTREECVEATTAMGFGWRFALVGSIWLLGIGALGGIWLQTRPLWRQGHGLRLRRLRREHVPWVPRTFSDPSRGAGGSR